MARTVKIPWRSERGSGVVSGRLARPRQARRPGMVLAPGAGAGQDHPQIVHLRDGIARAGHPVLTFDYPYREAGRNAPDPTWRLLAAHRGAVERFETLVHPRPVLGGRSMGGRMASMLVADGLPAAGLVLYAYPLHPAGRPDRLRVEHLARITVPMLFFVGTRDPLCRLDLYDRHVRPLPNVTTVVIEDADHGFKVRTRETGLTHEQVLDRIVDETVRFLDGLG